MKNQIKFIVFASIALLSSCIKDDFIDDMIEPELSITTLIDTLAIDTEFQFESRYLNNIGQDELIDVIWTSSAPEVISITPQGLATGISSGSAIISVADLTDGSLLETSLEVHVGQETVVTESAESISGQIVTTTFYDLEGGFTLSESDDGLLLDIDDDYLASDRLPGLYIYLTNNRNSIADAKEISKVTVFRGAHSYMIPDATLADYNFILYYCKPFNVKVGEAVLN